MASIHLQGILVDSVGEIDVGGVITFTHLTTTGDTIASTQTELIIPPDGAYSIDVEYGQIRIDYTTRNTERFVANVIVNSASTATSLPELLSATTPVAKPIIIQMQGLVADATAAATTAEAFADQLTTFGLIGSVITFAPDTKITTKGYTTSGDGGSGSWIQNGVTGQTVSQSPAQLGDGLLNDANGAQWQLVADKAGVFVTSFGANTSTNNSHLEIQAAIDYCKRLSINLLLVPEGNFRLGAQLTITHTLLIKGGGSSSTAFYSTHAGNGVVFQPENAGTGWLYLDGGGIEGINVTRVIASSGGTAVWLRQCNGLRVTDVGGSNHDFGFRISGGQLNTIDKCRSFCSAPYTGEIVADSAGIVMEKADIGGGSLQDCYTVVISNWYSSANKLQRYGILIHSVDGLSVVNTYTGYYSSSNMRFKRKLTTDTITAVQVTNSYFDCVGTTGTPSSVIFLNDSGIATESGGRNVKFVNCFFGNNGGTGNALVRLFSYADRLIFDACTFGSTESSAIRIASTAGASFGTYIISNNCFSGTNKVDTASGAISIDNAQRLSVSNNDFNDVGTTCLVTGGAFEGIVVSDNTKLQSTQMITQGTATYLEQFIRNLGDSDGSSISYTPTLTIGGVAISTGSYSLQIGQYSLNSGVVTFQCRIAITSKEAQSGALEITGLPIPCNSTSQAVSVVPINTNTTSSGIYSQIIAGTGRVQILKGSTTSSSANNLVDTEVFSTLSLKVSGSYFTN